MKASYRKDTEETLRALKEMPRERRVELEQCGSGLWTDDRMSGTTMLQWAKETGLTPVETKIVATARETAQRRAP